MLFIIAISESFPDASLIRYLKKDIPDDSVVMIASYDEASTGWVFIYLKPFAKLPFLTKKLVLEPMGDSISCFLSMKFDETIFRIYSLNIKVFQPCLQTHQDAISFGNGGFSTFII